MRSAPTHEPQRLDQAAEFAGAPMSAMEIDVGTTVNLEATTAWQQASTSLGGSLSRPAIARLGVATMVLGLLALGIMVIMGSTESRTDREWAKSWSLVGEIAGTVERASAQLRPIQIKSVAVVRDGGMDFALLLADPLSSARKVSATASLVAGEDPLSVENVPPEMVVFDSLFDQYALILNKYPVFEGHSLLVTRNFAPQSNRLTKWDLDALHRCATAADAIGFFNSDTLAGSSQPHRHLQLVPLASMTRLVDLDQVGIFSQVDALPEEFWKWSGKTPFFPVVRKLAALEPIAHGLVRLPSRATFDIDFARYGGFADALLRSYVVLASQLDVLDTEHDAPHNVLLHRGWILVVKRTVASVAGIGLNGLAYTGFLVIKEQQVFDLLTQDNDSLPTPHRNQFGPLAILQAASAPTASADPSA